MRFFIVLDQVMILFIILGIGYVGAKGKILDQNATKKLSEVLLYITSPMLVLKSFFFEFSSDRLMNAIWICVMGVAFFCIAILLSKFLFYPFPEKVNPVMRFTAIFSNCGYMGLPMLKALYGDEGVFYGSFYVVIFHMFLWSYGIRLFGGNSGKNAWKKVFLNPAIIAVYIGMLIFVLRIPIPEVVQNSVKSVGDMTMPLSMLIIGAVISTAKFKDVINDLKVYYTALIRLVVMPLLGLFLVNLLGIPQLPGAVLVTALCMPAAANTTIFSEMYGKDAVFGSKCVTVSTLLSIATAPVIISLIKI
jgi:predicted permease